MFGNLNPKKISSMMSKLGIKQEDIEAKKVIIEQEDKNIVIENPNVVKINMSGQETFQISGDIKVEEKILNEEDITTIIEKTGASKEKAEVALKNSRGDLAEAILSLS